MKKKRRHVASVENTETHIDPNPEKHSSEGNHTPLTRDDEPKVEIKRKKNKQVFARVSIDPTKRYRTPESRESWGPNVKGKQFRKEKGKKKRCPNAGVRIDGSVKSVRLDA